MRRLVLIVGLLAVIGAGVVLGPFVPEPVEPPVALAREGAVVVGTEPGRNAVEWVGAMLDRPLFEPGRRTPAQEVAMVEPESVPRLTGIIVSDSTRRALFAGGEGVTRGEGERLGAFTVTAIRAGSVELAGPTGLQTVYLAHDAGFRAALAAARPLAALVGAVEREMLTENDQ